MAIQEGTGLFVGGDTLAYLLNDMLGELPRSRQIEYLTSALRKQEVWRAKNAISLVQALEKLFEDKAAFRAQLMESCNAIPMQAASTRSYYNEQEEVAAELRLAMIAMIIQGWSIKPNLSGLAEDAEACFCFVCQTYKSAPQHQEWGDYPNPNAKLEEGRVRKGILNLFREHLDQYGSVFWGSNLDRWIVHEQTPDAIAIILLHAQIRLGGVAFARERIRRISS